MANIHLNKKLIEHYLMQVELIKILDSLSKDTLMFSDHLIRRHIKISKKNAQRYLAVMQNGTKTPGVRRIIATKYSLEFWKHYENALIAFRCNAMKTYHHCNMNSQNLKLFKQGNKDAIELVEKNFVQTLKVLPIFMGHRYLKS